MHHVAHFLVYNVLAKFQLFCIITCRGILYFVFWLACVAGGMRERASGGGAAIFLAGEAREEFASGEAASEFPACHISYGFCLPPTFIAFDESIK